MHDNKPNHAYASLTVFRLRQLSVFIITFMGYASFHACRQSFPDAQDELTKTAKWDQTFNKGFEGTMDGIFLFTYALGMLFVGAQLGDRFDASTVHSVGLLVMAIIYFIMGASIPLFNLHSKGFFVMLWAFNGLVQSVGWYVFIYLYLSTTHTKWNFKFELLSSL